MPVPSRQSWGSSLTWAENPTAASSRNGIVTTESADCTSVRPRTPSGLTDQYAWAEPSSSTTRAADNASLAGGPEIVRAGLRNQGFNVRGTHGDARRIALPSGAAA